MKKVIEAVLARLGSRVNAAKVKEMLGIKPNEFIGYLYAYSVEELGIERRDSFDYQIIILVSLPVGFERNPLPC